MYITINFNGVNSWGAASGKICSRIKGIDEVGCILENLQKDYGMDLEGRGDVTLYGSALKYMKKYIELSQMKFTADGKLINMPEKLHVLSGEFLIEYSLNSVKYQKKKRGFYGNVVKDDKTYLEYRGSKVYMGAGEYRALVFAINDGDYPEEEIFSSEIIDWLLEQVHVV